MVIVKDFGHGFVTAFQAEPPPAMPPITPRGKRVSEMPSPEGNQWGEIGVRCTWAMIGSGVSAGGLVTAALVGMPSNPMVSAASSPGYDKPISPSHPALLCCYGLVSLLSFIPTHHIPGLDPLGAAAAGTGIRQPGGPGNPQNMKRRCVSQTSDDFYSAGETYRSQKL